MTGLQPLLGVSTCLFRAGAVLLVERRNPPFAGRLSLPGGKVRFGETLAEAARREIAEETGLNVDDLVFLHPHEIIDEANGVHAVIAVFRAARELDADAEPMPGDDARSCGFHKVEALAALEADGKLTGHLDAIVRAAYRAHLNTS